MAITKVSTELLKDNSVTINKLHSDTVVTASKGLHNHVNDNGIPTAEAVAFYVNNSIANVINSADPTLTISGDASGSATFTNLGNATLSLTIADDSHNHIISNIDGLQSALNGKQAAGTYNTIIGTDTDIDTSGDTIVDNIYVTDGVITSMGTRTLTLGDLGYIGDTNANYITNNNQLTNGAEYISEGALVLSQASWVNATKFKSAGDINQGAGNHSLQIYSDINNDAFIAFHVSGDYAVNFGLDNTTNRLYVGGWSDPSKYQMWDSRDFSSTNISNWNTAYGWGDHSIAGYITSDGTSANSNHLNSTRNSPNDSLQYWQASGLGTTEAPSTDWHNTIRMGHGDPLSYYSNTLAIRMTGTGIGDIYTQTIANGSAQGWKKHWNDGNDGSGSGLDADLLDGLDSTQFLRSDTSSEFVGQLTVDNTNKLSSSYTWTNSAIQTTSIEIIDANSDDSSVCPTLIMHNYGDGGVKFRMGNTGDKTLYLSSGQSNGAGNPVDDNSGVHFNEMRINNNKVWHAANDGSGSGLDADLLDGQHGSYYQPVNNTSVLYRGTITSQDWNTYINGTQAGFYQVSNASGANKPPAYTYGTQLNFTTNGANKLQIYAPHNGTDSNGIWIRTGWSTDYDAWREIPMYGVAPYSGGDLRASIFYDSDNTGYYGNFAGETRYNSAYGNYLGLGVAANTSGPYVLNMGGSIDMNAQTIDYLSQLHFNDNVRFYDDGNDSYLNFKYGDANYGGIAFRRGDNTLKGYLYADNAGFGLLDSDGAWAVRTQTGTSPLTLYCDANEEFQVHTSYTLSLGSSRAPIFYDSNDTGYYIDPASTSRFNRIDFGDSSYYVHAGDWGMRNTTPHGWIQFGPANSSYAHIYTDMPYFYFNKELLVNGATVWSSGNDGAGSGLDADLLDGLQSSFAPTANTVPIRNANGDISAREITLSSAISAQTPTVLVSMYPTTNQLVRTTPAAVAASMGAWTSSNDGAGSGLDADLLDGLNSNRFVYGGEARKSNLVSVFANVNEPSGFYYGNNVANAPTTDWINYMHSVGDSWVSSNNYSFQLTHAFHSDNLWVSRTTNGTQSAARLILDSGSETQNKSGILQSNSSLRAPIFYDVNNTTYYLDPAGQSRLGNIERLTASSGFLIGSYNTAGANSGNTNPIYTIGNNYKPTDTSIAGMYGIGYAHPNLWGSGKTSSWGLYVAEAGVYNCTIGGGATTIWAQNDIVAYSDRRVKDNIEIIPNAIEKIKQLNGVTFTRTDAKEEDKDKRHTGVIAQDVLKVLPEAVVGSEEDLYSVAYGNMVGLLIEAIKEQQSQIDELKQLINKQ